MIDQKVQDEPNHSRDIVESGADVKEKELKMRIQVLQKESDLREKERHLKNEENKQLREEVANLKALLQDNAMNDIYYDSDNEDNKKDTSHATGSEKRVERKSESVTHQSKVIVNSDRNSVDLNYDSDENCADPNDDSDNHYADPYYDSSDSEGHR
jgi:ATP phosphoribosyltransferase